MQTVKLLLLLSSALHTAAHIYVRLVVPRNAPTFGLSANDTALSVGKRFVALPRGVNAVSLVTPSSVRVFENLQDRHFYTLIPDVSEPYENAKLHDMGKREILRNVHTAKVFLFNLCGEAVIESATSKYVERELASAIGQNLGPGAMSSADLSTKFLVTSNTHTVEIQYSTNNDGNTPTSAVEREQINVHPMSWVSVFLYEFSDTIFDIEHNEDFKLHIWRVLNVIEPSKFVSDSIHIGTTHSQAEPQPTFKLGFGEASRWFLAEPEDAHAKPQFRVRAYVEPALVIATGIALSTTNSSAVVPQLRSELMEFTNRAANMAIFYGPRACDDCDSELRYRLEIVTENSLFGSGAFVTTDAGQWIENRNLLYQTRIDVERDESPAVQQNLPRSENDRFGVPVALNTSGATNATFVHRLGKFYVTSASTPFTKCGEASVSVLYGVVTTVQPSVALIDCTGVFRAQNCETYLDGPKLNLEPFRVTKTTLQPTQTDAAKMTTVALPDVTTTTNDDMRERSSEVSMETSGTSQSSAVGQQLESRESVTGQWFVPFVVAASIAGCCCLLALLFGVMWRRKAPVDESKEAYFAEQDTKLERLVAPVDEPLSPMKEVPSRRDSSLPAPAGTQVYFSSGASDEEQPKFRDARSVRMKQSIYASMPADAIPGGKGADPVVYSGFSTTPINYDAAVIMPGAVTTYEQMDMGGQQQ